MMYGKVLGLLALATLALALPQYSDDEDHEYGEYPNIDYPPTLKMSCSRLVLDRIDPLTSPGVLGTSSLNQIVGGDAFNATMDPADDPAERATCTTCTFTDDFSNYWTPAMYFRARNGSYKRVEQLGALFHKEARGGGMTVYYLNREIQWKSARIRAFAPGFRMRIGRPDSDSPTQAPYAAGREGPDIYLGDGVTYTCLYTAQTRQHNLTWTFPDRPCREGILTTITFPPCWDGQNLDSPDHASHVAYTEGDDASGVGGDRTVAAPCPASHPVRIPKIRLETRWDTRPFNDPDLWPADGSQPFVWSFGDRAGYGLHAEYVYGWRGNALQDAFDRSTCLDMLCEQPVQSIPEANECMLEPSVPEEVDGWLDALPGGAVAWD